MRAHAYVVMCVLVWSSLGSLLSLNHTHLDYKGLLSIFWRASIHFYTGAQLPPPPLYSLGGQLPKN